MQRKETIMKYYHANVMIDNKQTEKEKEHIINHYKQILENELNYAPNDEVILLIKRMMKSKKKNLSRFSR